MTEFAVVATGLSFPEGPVSMPDAPDYSGGRIERVYIATGRVEEVYRSCNGHPLTGPNDLVFDHHGGFYFTDHARREEPRRRPGSDVEA